MIDFHTHILPSIDDGSENIEQSVKMLKIIKEQNVDGIVATPHFDLSCESVSSFIKKRNDALMKIPLSDTFPQIFMGAEVLYNSDYLYKVDDLDELCIGNSRYMLIECPAQPWGVSFRDCILKLIYERDIIPIIAHVERYSFLGNNMNVLLSLIKHGVLMQMNSEFIIDKRTRRIAFKMINNGSVQLLGSDCHNTDTRPPNLNEAVNVIRKHKEFEFLYQIDEISADILL